ncbi:MAG: M3 family metallopeptidase [Bacteroidetes bacterium]|nr:M3 family metallopeptidase [Bacteroidota bacterium]
MKKSIYLFLILGLISMSCTNKVSNPFLVEWNTPFQTPPFDKIKTEHYVPAFKEGIKLHNDEIKKIADNKDAPSFQNTIEALDYSGKILTRVRRVFTGMNEAMTNDEMGKISKEISTLRSNHRDDIYLNAKLFERVKAVNRQKDKLGLNKEQQMLMNKYYSRFVRGGANLSDKDKEAFRKLNTDISLLTLKFGENVLSEINKFELIIDKKEDLAGLPQGVIDAAAATAKDKDYTGKWVFTIHKPSMIPFLQYAKNRKLREKIYYAYTHKGDNNNEFDNKKILSQIASLRLKRANLLGYKTHAGYVLDDQMAKKPGNVYELLNKVWSPAVKVAKKELTEMQKIIYKEGKKFKLASWDWWHYGEKLKKQKYDLDEEQLRPYFKLQNVINGVFNLAATLFDIQFVERKDIPKYHPEVKTFEVKDKQGNHIAILYTDYFPRASKRGGAWMDAFRKQSKENGKFIHPVIYNVGNFTKPTPGKPSLLSVDEVETLFHEFGHAIHGMLSDCTYEAISGTDTPRDFVEFPSQVMENWAMHPDVLNKYAKHFETGKVIPINLIEKITNSSKFNQGFKTVEYLAASYLDMAWYTITDTTLMDAAKFENKTLNDLGLIPEIYSRYRSTYFNHIFSGDYSSGYYSYIWSEVLDADAFAAFVESGDVYNKELAGRYKKYILSAGGTDDAMTLYKKFRGKDPIIEPLLVRRGLK